MSDRSLRENRFADDVLNTLSMLQVERRDPLWHSLCLRRKNFRQSETTPINTPLGLLPFLAQISLKYFYVDGPLLEPHLFQCNTNDGYPFPP